MNIKGKSVVVTGGGSGLGRASAEMLAEKGAKVAIIDMNGEAAETVAAITGLTPVAAIRRQKREEAARQG